MHNYLSELQKSFELKKNTSHAEKMSAYLKHQFYFLGIKQPARKEFLTNFNKDNGWPDIDNLETVCKELWNLPYREYQYIALDLMIKRIKVLPENWLSVIEFFIINKSWWDTVDILSAKIAGEFFHYYPQLIPTITERWIADKNIWLKRSALLFQLKYKTSTDTKRLFDYINQTRHMNEFFIKKAIGWILREYSKTNPELVKKFINDNQLKPLSKREGLKWLKKQGEIT